MSKAEIVKSLEYILEEIDETPDDSMLDLASIIEGIEDIIKNI